MEVGDAGDGAIRAPLSNAWCRPPANKGCRSGCVVASVGVLTAATTTTGGKKMSTLTRCDGIVLFWTSDQLTESGA